MWTIPFFKLLLKRLFTVVLWLKEKQNALECSCKRRKKFRRKKVKCTFYSSKLNWNSCFKMYSSYLSTFWNVVLAVTYCYYSKTFLKCSKTVSTSLKQVRQKLYTSNLLSKFWNSFSRSWKPSAKAPPDGWNDNIPIIIY